MLAREAAALRRADKAARKGQLRDELSAALHAQFELALRAGRHDDAERLAAVIPGVFAPIDPRRFVAARGVAATWLCADHPGRARDALRPALRAATGPEERIRLHVLAIRAAIELPWSNGPTEGHINRLKTLKRQMYGRAGFEVLRARVLAA